MTQRKQKLKKEPKQRPRSEKKIRERKPTPKKVKYMKHKKD